MRRYRKTNQNLIFELVAAITFLFIWPTAALAAVNDREPSQTLGGGGISPYSGSSGFSLPLLSVPGRGHDVVHYCVPNIASRVARTASFAVSNILTPILLKANNVGSIEHLLLSNPGLRHGVYTYKGCLCNEYLGERFDIKTTRLELLITSDL